MKSIKDNVIYVGPTTHPNVSKNMYSISKRVFYIARVIRKSKSISSRGDTPNKALVKLDKRLIEMGYEPIHLKSIEHVKPSEL